MQPWKQKKKQVKQIHICEEHEEHGVKQKKTSETGLFK